MLAKARCGCLMSSRVRRPNSVLASRSQQLRGDLLVLVFALVTAFVGCHSDGYTLVSDEYGFSVTFPERPIRQTDKNKDGLPKYLWTLYRDDHKDFYSSQATSYKEILPTEGWVPGKEVGEVAGIELMEGRRFWLRSAKTGRQVVAVETTSLAPAGGIISTIYIIDGSKLISVTARTRNENEKAWFLKSLTLLR